jgi:membrane associated rhomboid family serine protease
MNFDIIGYAKSLFLITAAHLSIPPLSCFSGSENAPEEVRQFFNALYQYLPSDVLNPKFVFSLLLTKDKLDKLKLLDSTYVTHIFVHGDYQHMFSNLLGTWLYSTMVFRDIGGVYTQLLYLSGGVVSSIPLEKCYQALKLEYTKFINQYLSRPTSTKTPSSWFGNTWSYLTAKFPKILLIDEVYCGSSGAVSTMMGFDLILQLRGAVVSAITVYQYNKGTMKRPRDEALLIGAFVFRVAQVYSIGNMIYGEYLSLIDQQQERQSWFRFFSGKIIINHRAHLQGFAYGALISLLRLALK